MVDKVVTAVITTSPAVQDATSKESAKSKPKKPHTKATHPRSSDMVNAAIGNLKERGGSSLQAIKKYIFSTYKVDAEKFAPFIKRYLKSAVATGNLIQTKGKGVSGSFKLPNKPVAPQPKGKRATRAVTAAKKVSIAKKSIASKKVAASKKIDAKKPVKRISNKKVSVKKSTAGAVLKKQKVTKTGTKTIPKTAKKAVKVSSAKLKSPKPKKAAPLKTAKFASKKK